MKAVRPGHGFDLPRSPKDTSDITYAPFCDGKKFFSHQNFSQKNTLNMKQTSVKVWVAKRDISWFESLISLILDTCGCLWAVAVFFFSISLFRLTSQSQLYEGYQTNVTISEFTASSIQGTLLQSQSPWFKNTCVGQEPIKMTTLSRHCETRKGY